MTTLSDRLLEHAAIHDDERRRYGDQHQAQWTADLREAAELLAPVVQAEPLLKPLSAWSDYGMKSGLLDSTGVAVDRMRAQAAFHAFAAGWNAYVKACAALAAPAPGLVAPDLSPVIDWLENGCDPKEAAKELRIYRDRMINGLAEAKPSPALAAPTREDLIAALQFYATGQHFGVSDTTAWDTVSGEPANWRGDEAGTAMVEDGTIAAKTLAGKMTAAQINADDDDDDDDDDATAMTSGLTEAEASATASVAGLAGVPAGPDYPFQHRVQPWMRACFGDAIAGDKVERNHRFLEEALELVQACGCTENEAHQLVAYTFGRPIGEPAQEVGGVMVTLAALCLAQGLDMHSAGETELARIWTKVEQIRAKQAAKPKHSPLPVATATAPQPEAPAAAQPVVPAGPTDSTWYEGAPPFPQDQEWFIAETIYGDRVVLRSLNEGRERKYTYDFKTADETYMAAKIIKKWMQFPDCDYLPPDATPVVPAGFWLAPDEPTPEIIEAICREMVPGRWPDAYSPETQLIWRQYAAQAHHAMRAAHLAADGRPNFKQQR